jgi:hypothetical protein
VNIRCGSLSLPRLEIVDVSGDRRRLFQKFHLSDEQQLLGRLAIDNGAISFSL